MEVVAGTVKPLGDRAGEYSNTNTPDRELVNTGSVSPIRIFSTQIF